MKKIIVVAGGTGNLGKRIISALLARGAEVHAPVRVGSNKEKVAHLNDIGVKVFEVDMHDAEELSTACEGASCVVSALQGLKEVIVDIQSALLDSAIAGGVSRFIPSDFSVDFTKISSENRNFDLRREFQQRLNKTSISATSVFNGAFADILGYNTPIFNANKKNVGYWGDNAEWHLDFTTLDDTAAFTAEAALDSNTPRALNIASFQVSPKDLVAIGTELTQSAFNLIPMGSLNEFAAYNKRERVAHPEGENELFPRWQSGQYMHDQFSSHHDTLDNNRYPDLKWTTAAKFISSIL